MCVYVCVYNVGNVHTSFYQACMNLRQCCAIMCQLYEVNRSHKSRHITNIMFLQGVTSLWLSVWLDSTEFFKWKPCSRTDSSKKSSRKYILILVFFFLWYFFTPPPHQHLFNGRCLYMNHRVSQSCLKQAISSLFMKWNNKSELPIPP